MALKDKRYLDDIHFRSKNGTLTAEPDLDSGYVADLIERSGAIELYGYNSVDNLLQDKMVAVEVSYDKKQDSVELWLYLLEDIKADSDKNHCICFTQDFLSKTEIEDFKNYLLSAEQIQKSEPVAER